MSALARWCYQHRFVVITAWIGLLIGLAVISQAVKTSYDNSFTLPGTGSGNAQQLLLDRVIGDAAVADLPDDLVGVTRLRWRRPEQQLLSIAGAGAGQCERS